MPMPRCDTAGTSRRLAVPAERSASCGKAGDAVRYRDGPVGFEESRTRPDSCRLRLAERFGVWIRPNRALHCRPFDCNDCNDYARKPIFSVHTALCATINTKRAAGPELVRVGLRGFFLPRLFPDSPGSIRRIVRPDLLIRPYLCLLVTLDPRHAICRVDRLDCLHLPTVLVTWLTCASTAAATSPLLSPV